MLVEYHILKNHAPSNLNRDDTGSPKDCVFGGVTRGRISSQCIKRSIRRSEQFTDEMKGVEMGVRTRLLPQLVKEALVKDKVPDDVAKAAAKKVTGFGNKDAKERDSDDTAQIMFFSQKEIDAVVNLVKQEVKGKAAADVAKIDTKDLQLKLRKLGIEPSCPDIAMFGRMITSDAFQDVEASMQVAHAISTNKIDHEFDFFTAVDDKKGARSEEDKGAGMMGDVEFNSACYYEYFSIDCDAFVENMTRGDKLTKDQAKSVLLKALRGTLKAAVFTSPSGKQNTFAAHQLPDAILVEVRPTKTPVSYANAFIKPAYARGNKDLMEDSIEKLASHVNVLSRKFALKASGRFWFTTKDMKAVPDAKIDNVTACEDIDALVAKLEETVKSGLK